MRGKVKSHDADHPEQPGTIRTIGEISAPQQSCGIGSLPCFSLPASGAKIEDLHPLLAGLSRFGEDGRAATIH